jgi:hypothetical protein
MERLIEIINIYKEDNPHVYITDSMIQAVIEDNIEELIKEIRKEI